MKAQLACAGTTSRRAGRTPRPPTRETAAELQVVVVGDEVAIWRGLELQLRQAGFRVIGLARSAGEAERIIVDRAPDVALVDLGLGDDDGVRVIRAVSVRRPSVAVLAYASDANRARLDAVFAAGARGCALKSGTPDDLFAAIRVLAAGRVYLDPRLGTAASEPPAERTPVLSPRQREILRLAATGLTTGEMAKGLVLSQMTVATHVRNAMKRLGAHNRTHAVALAVSLGEIELGGAQRQQ